MELEKQKKIMRALVILDALVIIIVAILRFAYPADQSPFSLKDKIWNFYWIIFGLMIIMAQFNVQILFRYFNFLESDLGRGLFHIFIGTIMLGLPAYVLAIGKTYSVQPFMLLTICMKLLTGIFNCVLGCLVLRLYHKSKNTKDLPQSNSIDKQQNGINMNNENNKPPVRPDEIIIDN